MIICSCWLYKELNQTTIGFHTFKRKSFTYMSLSVLIYYFVSVEVEGYGPYKPVPPPKPLPQQTQQQFGGCLTPPPYRMPPYPLYNEPNIPGTAGLDSSTSNNNNVTSPLATSSPSGGSQGLQTHSSKFPVSVKKFILRWVGIIDKLSVCGVWRAVVERD